MTESRWVRYAMIGGLEGRVTLVCGESISGAGILACRRMVKWAHSCAPNLFESARGAGMPPLADSRQTGMSAPPCEGRQECLPHHSSNHAPFPKRRAWQTEFSQYYNPPWEI